MSNPVLNEKFIDRTNVLSEPVTMNGVLQKTIILFLILLASATFTWFKGAQGYGDLTMMLTQGGAIVGLILALIICFAKAFFLIPLYAIAEGLFLGGISYIMESVFPGIVQTAVLGTIMAIAGTLFLYSTKLIKCSEKLISTIYVATFAIFGVYLIQIIGNFFGYSIPGLFDNGYVGIAFSVLVIGIAAFNLIVDFHFIETAVNNFAPKKYEWYFGFSLVVTVVWIYVEILRLIAKTRSRN